MSGIEELRQRVQDAEDHFGLAREEQAKYSERLIGLIDTVEGRLRDQQAEIDRLQAIAVSHDEALAKEQAQIGRFERENEHLREMLHSLLRAIESGGRSGVVEIMQTLDQKVSALIAGDDAPAEAAAPEPEIDVTPEPEIEAELPEPVEEAAVEPVAEAAPELEMEAELLEPVEEAAVEPAAEAAPELEMEAELPEPVEEAAPEPVAEAAPEPEIEAELPEPAEEIAAAAVVEPAAELAAGAATAEDNSTIAALEEIASQLAAPSAGDSAAVSDSLHEIMDRVSRLVRDSEDAEAAAAAAPAEAATPPEKKSAAG